MGASTGMIGTAIAQYHLRQCFVFLNMFPINRPELMISHAAEKIDQNGTLKDEKAKQLIAQLIKNLIVWTGKIEE